MDDNIPSPEEVLGLPIHGQADLDRLWRALMGELGFTRRRLWVLLVCDDGQPLPHVMHIDEVPDLPGEQLVHLLEICRRLDEEVGVAVLLSRPGSDDLSPADKAWASALATAARRTGVSCWPLHVANDVAIRVAA